VLQWFTYPGGENAIVEEPYRKRVKQYIALNFKDFMMIKFLPKIACTVERIKDAVGL